jgi:hypothetical protein
MADWWSGDQPYNPAAPTAPAGAWWAGDRPYNAASTPQAAPTAAPEFGSDEYVNALAQKHGVDPAHVRGLVNSQVAGEGLKGTPILGGLVDKAGAGISALAQPLTGAGAQGGSIGERYGKNLGLEHELASDFERAHPNVATAANLAGGLATTGGVAQTALGARLLGMTGGNLPRQMLASGLSGSAINATDAAIRGTDPSTGAEIGGALGVLGPVAGRVAGTVAQGAGRLIRGGNPPAVPGNISRVAGVDVPLSSGQATGDVATQMMENTALRGGEGQAPQRVAEQFFRGEQAPAVEQARGNIGEGLGGQHGNVVDNPQEAGQLIGEGVRSTEQASRQNYRGLYNQALSLPGEIHADAFEGIGQKIKGDLSLRQNPVIIDDVTTPVAARALKDIDSNISQLRIQNRADPLGAPKPTTETKTIISGPGYHIADDISVPPNIVGINLQGVDQVRKRLTALASATERGSADQRAMRQVIGAFDNHVEDSISNGLFTGDDRALDALRAARSAYSQHQQLFKSQGAGDDVGRAMEKIVGRNGGDGATPTEVANYLYGTARVGGTGLSVRLAQRMQQVLGPDSPEWTALRQGLWSRLSHATEGTTEMGPQKVSGRISEFLNGSGAPLAQVVYSPAERQMMKQFAGLQQQLTPKPGTVNYSNTAPVLRMLTANTLKGISLALGGAAAGPAGMVASYGVNQAGQRLVERSAAGRVARSLYNSPAQNATESRFLQQMGRYGALGARMLPPPQQQSSQP